MEKYEVHITCKNKPFSEILPEIIRYKDLILLFVKKNFSLVYKQTILGPLWLVLQPLVSSIVFTFIFGQVIGVPTDGFPQILFFLCGTSIWTMFSSCLSGISSTFVANAYLFSKVYFPRLTIPLSQAIGGLLKFMIQFLLIVCVYVYFALVGMPVHLDWHVVLIPLLLVQAIVLAMAVGIIISSLTIKYRDLSLATGLIIQLWMYGTPVVYPLTQLSGTIKQIILLNPMTPIVNNFRFCLLGSGGFLTIEWVISIIITIALLFIGVALFNKTQKSFVDVV